MIILDTNVVSELMSPEPAERVLEWVGASPGRELATTAITVAEIGYGIQRLPDGKRRRQLANAAAEVFGAYSDSILAFDRAAADEYGPVIAACDAAGRPISALDGQIASICKACGAALATRNVDDFTGTGIEVVNPFIKS